MEEDKMSDFVNNKINLSYLIWQINNLKGSLKEHRQKLDDLMEYYLNHASVRATKFTAVAKYVRQGIDVDDLNQEVDVALLELADKYLLGKSEGEVVAYIIVALPRILDEIVRCKLRPNPISLTDKEEIEEIFEYPQSHHEEVEQIKVEISKMEGTIKDVGMLMLEGKGLVEIEKMLKLGPGSGWYYKEMIVKKLRQALEENPTE
jgi:hypothetical protein